MKKRMTDALAHVRDRLWRNWQRRLKLPKRRFERRRLDFLRYHAKQRHDMGWDE